MKDLPVPASALLASVLGLGSGTALAAGAVNVPEGAPWWLGWLFTGCMTAAPLVISGVARYRAARAERLAQAERLRAAKLRADGDPSNDGHAAELEERAVEHEAEAAGLRALDKGRE